MRFSDQGTLSLDGDKRIYHKIGVLSMFLGCFGLNY